jgi:hypothetical protein
MLKQVVHFMGGWGILQPSAGASGGHWCGMSAHSAQDSSAAAGASGIPSFCLWVEQVLMSPCNKDRPVCCMRVVIQLWWAGHNGEQHIGQLSVALLLPGSAVCCACAVRLTAEARWWLSVVSHANGDCRLCKRVKIPELLQKRRCFVKASGCLG